MSKIDVEAIIKEGDYTQGSSDETAYEVALRALANKVEKLQVLVEAAAEIFDNSNVVSSICVCGDYMDNHDSGMDCGHAPVDMSQYYLCQWQEMYRAISQHDGGET